MEFMLGCNYWASNAGTEMWVNWDEAAIEKDLCVLGAHGMKYLRVFPNWRDFQPVCGYYGIDNRLYEYRHINGSLFEDPNYLDSRMMDLFERFCTLARSHGIKLIVGLLTGWMSGRLFTPPILEGKNLITDPIAQVLEQRFIKGIVSRFYGNEAICAWDLGNECSCMSDAGSRDAATAWTAMVVNAIKANDPTGKPVISGLAGLRLDDKGLWNVFDHGEFVDVTTTHPYPMFTRHCDVDGITGFRTLLHATCQGAVYADLSGKPCLTEEIGTLGPTVCDDETAAAFLKTNLYSNWAAGSLGLLWWCGCEQIELETAPYSWNMIERELGLMDRNSEPKKTLLVNKAFDTWLKGFGKTLPKASVDAVCVLTDTASPWGTAYMSGALAKQAHVNLKFASGKQKTLPEGDIYLLPSISGGKVIPKEHFDWILHRVEQGATLYISNYNGSIADFERITGVRIKDSMVRHDALSMELRTDILPFWRSKRYVVEAVGAEVLAYDSLGIPAFTKHSYGKGIVFYLNFPLEDMLLDKPDAFDSNRYRVYETLFESALAKHPVTVQNPFVGKTLHWDGETCYAVLINYSDKPQQTGACVDSDYEISEVYGGSIDMLPANEAVVLTVRRKRNE